MFDIIVTERQPGLKLKKQSNQILSEKQAWEISIEKWNLLYHLCKQGKLIDDGGTQTCGLCTLYFYSYEDECERCPIKKAGYPACEGTPYKEYRTAVEKGSLELAKQAAAGEIEFLRNLYGLRF